MKTTVQTRYGAKLSLAATLVVSLILAASLPNLWAQQEARKERIAKTTAAMTEVTADLETLKSGIAATTSALKRMVATAKTDPKPAYKLYLEKLATLEKDTANLRAKVVGMEARSQELYAAWNAEVEQIGNKQLRKAAEKRYGMARNSYENILGAGEKAKDAFSPLLDNLRDIRTYLENELSERGLRRIDSLVRRTAWDAESAIRRIDNVIKHIDEVKTTLNSKEGF